MEKIIYGAYSARQVVEMRRNRLCGSYGFVLGQPGSGKTLTVVEQIRAILENTRDRVVVLAADNDYRAFAEQVGGQVFDIGGENSVQINPLDLYLGDDFGWDVRVSDKIRCFFISWFEEMMLVDLTDRQKRLLDRAVKKVFAPFYASQDVVTGERDFGLLPTLSKLYDILRAYDDEDMKVMADCLELCVHGSLQEFSGVTNAVHDSRLVVYDFHDTAHTMRTCAMMAVMESVWSRHVITCCGSGKAERIWFVVDDAWYLLRSKVSVVYLYSFAEQVRSMGCIFTGVTMDVESFRDFAESMSLISNADYVQLMKQYAGDKKLLQDFFSLSDKDWEKLKGASVGEGLFLFDPFC